MLRQYAGVTRLEDLLDKYLFESGSTSERGTKFERLVQSFLKTDTQWSARYDEVWTWMQWPEHHGHDTGIDLIARERDTGHLGRPESPRPGRPADRRPILKACYEPCSRASPQR